MLEGYLNIDIVPPADLVCDIREGLPLNDKCVEFIFSEHMFEHLDYPISIKKLLKECLRVLKKDGQIVIGVPDAKKTIIGYINNDQELFNEYMDKWYSKRNCKKDFNTWLDIINYVLRDQDDDAVYNPHYWGYDYEKLVSILKETGFKNVEPWKYDHSIGNSKREWGAVYVIATK
jgi:ubiquinone/menaquinone biosynthesis C-methylase UbiE